MKTVFIDGSAGTTGIHIHERLYDRTDIKLNILTEEERKEPSARREAIQNSDIAILCLPDAAAAQAVSWCEEADTIIIDTSTAHRTKPGWVYGFPELATSKELAGSMTGITGHAKPGSRMRRAIKSAKRIANPGCHASGFIALISPLVQAGLISRDLQLNCFSLTGYSGGGKSMINDYEQIRLEGMETVYDAPRVYALSQNHKHIPEMQRMTGLKQAPNFIPVVANYRQGMEVLIPLYADMLNTDCPFLKNAGIVGGGSRPTPVEAVSALYWQAYPGPIVHFEEHMDEDGFMAAGKLAGRDDMEITVAGNEERIMLIARFDNLGKGACGAAIQNMNLVLGCDETAGLIY